MKRFKIHPVLLSFLKLIPVSLCSIVIIAIFSIIFGFIAQGGFTLRYVFNANFLTAVIIIVFGIVIMLFPTILTMLKDKLVDSSTYIEKSYDKREDRQGKARIVLWLGIYNMVFTGLIQLLLSVII